MREIPLVIDKLSELPSVDRLVNDQELRALVSEYGRRLVADCARSVLQEARSSILGGAFINKRELKRLLIRTIKKEVRPSLRPVTNLSGTILNTNLGRAILPTCAIEAIVAVARNPSNLEFDLNEGKRNDRYEHVESLLCRLTGAEKALVVNNNAAAILLALNSLANKKEVPVSRGELVEIGGSFRIPDIMAQSGCKLIEVGTTNRTHEKDFETVIGPKTALIMKVHTSNFEIKGFVKSLEERQLAKIAHRHNLWFVTDLGSGTLIKLDKYSLPNETTVTEALQAGADLVTFSGDKLLGGPQAGIIVGKSDLIEKLKKNPLARAMRSDKLTLAALEAVLRLYKNPDSLETELPTFRWFNRDLTELKKLANRLLPTIKHSCKGFKVNIVPTETQIGSGALPVALLPSLAFQITVPSRNSGKGLNRLAKAFRNLSVPVVGRIAKDALIFDLRCLEDEKSFIKNLQDLNI